MADGENPIQQLEDENDQLHYRQGVQQIQELINNNPLVLRQQRPDDMQWRLQRLKTIRTLNELRTKLDLVCVGSNYGKGVGSGAKLSGAVASIIGAVMALGKSPSAATVMNIGELISNSGSLVEGVSHIVESWASAEYLREVKAILDKDQELSQPLQEWLIFSRGLDANMRIIFGSDINSAIRNNVLKVFSEFTTLYNSTRGFHETLEDMNKGQYAIHIGTDVAVNKLLSFSKELDVSPQLRDTIVKLSESSKLLRVAKDGVQVYQNLFGEGASPTEHLPPTQMPISSANCNESSTPQGCGNADETHTNNASSQIECPSVKTVSAFCAFQAIEIATSVVSLMSAVIVIRDGKSKFSDAIKQITDLLEAELRSMDELN